MPRAAALRRWARRVGRQFRHLQGGKAMTVANLAGRAEVPEDDLLAAEAGLRPLNCTTTCGRSRGAGYRTSRCVGELDG